ncbi:unnamed protein product, partial [Vitis vinifera]
MEIHTSYVEAFWGHVVFPYIVLNKGEQNSDVVFPCIDEYKRSITEYNPSSFLVVAEHFLISRNIGSTSTVVPSWILENIMLSSWVQKNQTMVKSCQ